MNLVDFEFSGFDALIFDMDGTLVDNMEFHAQAWPIWARREGLELSDEEVLSRTHGTISDIVARFFPDHSREERFQIGERKESLYRQLYAPHLRLLPGCADLLGWTRGAKMPVALATAGDANNIAFTLDGLQIRAFFSAVVGGEEVSVGKPDPEVFLLAAQRLGMAPEKCLVFEDSPAGVEAARRAGMKCIVINPMTRREQFGDTSHVLQWARDYREIAHNPWQKLASREIYENPWIRVHEDQVIRPDGNSGIYGVVSMKNRAVGIVPLHDDGTVTLVGQFRYTTNEYSWEIPEGGCPRDEPLVECARRELLEETGLIPRKIKPIGAEIHLSNSVSDERAYLFLATGLMQGEANPEGTEKLVLRRVKLEEAVEMALRGEIHDGLSVLALLLTRDPLVNGTESLLSQTAESHVL